jgi:serine/threonine-protein kinase
MGPYRLEVLIGQGGMGRVYRARHALLRRPTAIKVLAANPENLQAVERFEREVRLTSRLTHPNTIAIYDYGRTADNRFYYAMEYIQGITLGQCVEEAGAQSEARTVFVMSQVCSALAEAHTAGLIHRDIKPGNIMLCERGGKSDFVKVLDFGLVWRLGLEKDNPAESMRGTPRYMTPEAIRDPASQDARSDVYQLGVLMYFFLTGTDLFSGDSIESLCAAHLHSAPERPSVRLGQAVSPEFEALVMSCLEKDAAKRPADACELLAHLETFDVHGQWGQEQARRWWQQWMSQHEELLLQRYSPCPETEELLV